MALVIVVLGVLACVLSTVALEGVDALGVPDIVIQIVPFLVLAACARQFSRVGLGTLAILLMIGTVVNQIGVYTSEGSTASIGLVLYPLLFAFGVGIGLVIDLALRDSAEFLRRKHF